MQLLSERMADRLTKDYSKSLGRKLARGLDNSICATKIFKTAAFSYGLTTAAAFLTDVIFHLSYHVIKRKRLRPVKVHHTSTRRIV